jgi:DNA-binding GntR family transcriptional regulator
MNNNSNTETAKPRLVKTQQAYEFIRTRIIDGTYGPGDRVIIDRVAAELNISISPVREAIRQLEADGFIQMIPYSGAIVQLLNDIDHEETHWVLSFLDGGATFLATGKMTEQDIYDLEEINQDMRDALDELDFEEIGVLNRKFHEKIYKRCGNAYLVDRLQQAWQRLEQVRKTIFTFMPRRVKDSIEEHDILIQLFKEKASPEKIEEFARQHKMRALYAIQHRKEKKSR